VLGLYHSKPTERSSGAQFPNTHKAARLRTTLTNQCIVAPKIDINQSLICVKKLDWLFRRSSRSHFAPTLGLNFLI
jgi:hypothetical protein